MKEENRLWFGENGDHVPRQKQFLSEIQDGVVPTSLLFHAQCGHNQEAKKELIYLLPGIGNAFETPKPSRLILKLLKLVNFDDDDIILDFFSGSATTAHAVLRLNAEDGGNRHFILVQLPEVCKEDGEAYKAGYKNICEIGKARIRRVGENLKEMLQSEGGEFRYTVNQMEPILQQSFFDANGHVIAPRPDFPEYENAPNEDISNQAMAKKLDIGFRVFKLDSTNLKTWDATPIEDNQLEILYDRMNAMVQQCTLKKTVKRSFTS